MAEVAFAHETEKSHEQDHQDAHAEAGGAAHGAAIDSPVKLQADGRAADAAIRRMSQGPHLVGDGGAASASSPSAGDGGMLTGELKTQIDGKDVTIPKGTAVEVKEVKKDGLLCKIFSSFGGKEAKVPFGSFKAEPGLTHKEEPGHTDEPEDYSFQQYKGILWNGAPKAGDVAQGYIGDCYLIAAMGAVAAANPGAIMKLFSPQKPGQSQYTVTLYLQEGWQQFKKHPITVDTNLPSKLDSMHKATPVYGMLKKDLNDQQTPMWPALLEKAYAQLMGGYDVIGQGGPPERAMEALTGVASNSDMIPDKEADVLAQFKGYQKAGQAVVCASLDSVQAKSQKGFSGAGDGPYTLPLKNDQGDGVELAKNTLVVKDVKGKAKEARDDGNNNVTGQGVKGTCTYGWGSSVTLNYDAGKGPAAADDLSADYSWRGQLDKSINLYASHAYIFESVTAEGKLQFKNPWGVENPNPIAPADFKRLFVGIGENTVPKDKGVRPAPARPA